MQYQDLSGGVITDRLDNHSRRFELNNELHARPFPKLGAPGRAAFIAIKPENDGSYDPEMARQHLLALLDRFDLPHPGPRANHHFAQLGNLQLKWENHSEFLTYTLFEENWDKPGFDADLHNHFPKSWLATAPGKLLTSAIVKVEQAPDVESAEVRVNTDLNRYFVRESCFASWVLEKAALVVGDFRIDENGHTRFAVLGNADTGPGRLGRITQRLLEIETYKSMALLTLPVARDVSRTARYLDARLAEIVSAMSHHRDSSAETLERLLTISAELNAQATRSAFRFSACAAYEAIVSQRIEILREERAQGRQSLSEFMHRRFHPAMRTCESSRNQLSDISDRASKAAELLSTRVNVKTAEQNRQLLEQMDRRADLQLRLQETVEGLSVVAISYYGVSLLSSLLAPLGKNLNIDKTLVTAALVLPVVLVTRFALKRMKARLASS